MATNDKNEVQKNLKAHDEPARIKAHKQDLLPEAEKEEETVVPPVTADVDETPKFIKYGAAVLLGLAFGLGCYVWVDGDGQNANLDEPKHTAAVATAEYFNQYGAYDDPTIQGVLPDPFMSPFEPTLDAGYVSEDVVVENVQPLTLPTIEGAMASTKPTGQGIAVTDMGTVVYLFETNSSDVEETKELTAIAQHATANGLCLDVRAYTDETGRPAYNQKLSEKRAKAIGDYLVAHGVPREKVSVHGMGPTHKYPTNAQDRRAEVVEVRR